MLLVRIKRRIIDTSPWSRVWNPTLVISTLSRLSQQDCKLKATLGCTVRCPTSQTISLVSCHQPWRASGSGLSRGSGENAWQSLSSSVHHWPSPSLTQGLLLPSSPFILFTSLYATAKPGDWPHLSLWSHDCHCRIFSLDL